MDLRIGKKRKYSNDWVKNDPEFKYPKLDSTTGPVFNINGTKIEKNSIFGCNTVYQINMNLENGDKQPLPQALKNKITRFQRPTTDFVKTKLFQKIENDIHDIKKPLVCIIHGFPGSGKSEIGCSLAELFPFEESDLFVKFHIQCSDKRHVIKDELVKLLNEIKSNNLLPPGQNLEAVKAHLNDGYPDPFIDILNTIQLPVLILIEDPTRSERKFLKQFVTSCLKAESCIHLYITARNKNIGLPGYGRTKSLENCVYYQVDGFSIDEAIEFLQPRDNDDIELQAVKVIAEKISCSPLGLIAVRAHCHQVDMSYEDYLDYFTDPETQLFAHNSEIEHLKAEYGDHVIHLFTAIVTLLKPVDGASALADNAWTLMKMASYCHHAGIPPLMFERFLQQNRQDEDISVKALSHKNRVEAGAAITHLSDSGICKLDGAKKSNRDCVISYHQAVATAVQMAIKSEPTSYLEYLKQTVTALASMVHKDMRQTKDNQFMNKMAPHIEAVISHAEEKMNFDKTISLDKSNFLFWMLMCHLYEVIGIVRSLGTLSYKESSENSLNKATQVIFNFISILTKNATSIESVSLKPDKPYQELANDIVQGSIKAGDKILPSFGSGVLDEYISNILQMKDKELDYLKTRENEKADDIDKIRERYNKSVGLNTDTITDIRNCATLFLNEDRHCRMIFCERLASILHTWGRVLLYYNVDITPDFRDRFKFYSQLSREISRQCFEDTKVRILFEHLASISVVPIMIKGLSKTNTLEKDKTHLECREILLSLIECENDVGSDDDYYEHGHVKEIQGSEYTKMILRRFLIRINARLLNSHKNDPEFIKSGDETYDELKSLSIKNKELIMAPKCLVYCGKYQAAKGDYSRSADDFLAALEAGIRQSSNLYAWACYNLARVVNTGDLSTHKNAAIIRCQDALDQKEQPDGDLIEKLTVLLKALKQ